MVFNSVQKRAGKRKGQRRSEQPTKDAAGAPVTFGPVYTALSDMEVGGRGVLGEFDMSEQMAERLMNLGFVPGLEVTVAQSGPGGDPRVYRVDGAEVALRRDLAKLIAVAPVLDVECESSLRPAATSTLADDHDKRPTLRSAKDGAPLDVGLSIQEASAD